MKPLLLDVSAAYRSLRKAPFFTCVAAGTLALGIAFNAIVFTAVNSILLRPLPYPNADRIVIVQGQERDRNLVGDLGASAFSLVHDHAASLEHVAAIYPSEAGVNLSGPATVSYAKALRVSKDFFVSLDTAPILGRTFDESDDKPDGPHVAVLSYSLWSHKLSKLPIGEGNLLRINGDEYRAIGVMPQSFHSYPEADLWLPLQLGSRTANLGADYRVIGRLRPDVSLKDAREELKQLSESYPLTQIPADERVSLVLQKLQDFETHDARKRLAFLSTAVFLVLLIACTNIAMLLLVRTSSRTHEIAIRCALGSSRGRLIRVFFLEGIMLALLGGLFGIILAKETLPFVLAFAPNSFALTAEIFMDGRVAVFTLGVCALTASLFGIAPSVKLSRDQLQRMLGETTFRATASAARTRTGRLLLIFQIALTLVLLSSSTLLLHHLLAVENIEPGFDVRHASVAQISLSARTFTTTSATVRVLDGIIQRLQSLPSVEGVATTNGLPLETGLNIPARPNDAPMLIEGVEYRLISNDYFQVMRIPLLQGRCFELSDKWDTQPVVIVNKALARKWWHGMDAPGHFVTVGEAMGSEFADKPRLVVGVVGDVHQSSLEYPSRPTIFVPMQQAPDRMTAYGNKYVLTSIILRVSGSEDVSEQVRAAVVSSDPDLSVASYRPLRHIVASSLTRERFYTFLTVTFGGFGLLTVAVGFYGLLSYQLSLRSREIAVRISLGAGRGQVVMLVVRQVTHLVAWGTLLGGAGAFFLMRVIAKQVYNVSAMSFGAFVLATVLLSMVSMLASLLTATQVASIEPMVVLRSE